MYISEVENFRMKRPLKEEVDEKGKEMRDIDNDNEIRLKEIKRKRKIFLISIVLDNIIIYIKELTAK